MNRLSSISLNQICMIESVDESDVKDRLYEMGIYPEQSIQVIRKAPFGDPLVVKIGNQEIILRHNEAELIIIKENKAH